MYNEIRRNLLVKRSTEKCEPLDEQSEIWIEFCKNISVNDSKEQKIANSIIERMEWIQEINFIWYKYKPKNEEMYEIFHKSNLIIFNRDNDERCIFLRDKKRWKKVDIIIMPM